jgi:hypothetical protein
MKNSALYEKYSQLQCKLTNVILDQKKYVLKIGTQRNFFICGCKLSSVLMT